MFQNILRPLWPNVDTSGLKGSETKTGKMENLQLLFFEFFVSFSGFRRHHVNIPWKGVECYAILCENLIQEFALPYNQLVRLEFAKNKCAKFGTLAKLRLIWTPWTKRLPFVDFFAVIVPIPTKGTKIAVAIFCFIYFPMLFVLFDLMEIEVVCNFIMKLKSLDFVLYIEINSHSKSSFPDKFFHSSIYHIWRNESR